MGYDEDIEQNARDFIEDHEDEITKGILEESEFYDLNELDDAIREEEFYFSLEDAVQVIQTSDNTEEDRGLWEGQQPEEALITKATYTAQNDLRIKIKELYDEMKEAFQNQISELTENKEQPEKPEILDDFKKHLAEVVFSDWKQEDNIEPLTKGSQEELSALQKWLEVNEHAGMRGGYPLGSSYIDARCGSGYYDMGNGMQMCDYIDLDHKVARQVPHLSGKRREDVQNYVAAQEKKTARKRKRRKVKK